MKETKRHTIHLSSTCNGRGGRGFLFLLTLLASLFVMPSCQEEDTLSETTEVMMTFTTRALVNATQGDTLSTAIDSERMKDLRVIMVRENGEIVGNHQVKNITKTSVTFKFRTPVNNGGEDFTFFAIANEGSITPANQDDLSLLTRAEGDKYTSEELNTFKNMQIGNGEFALSDGQSIPQTKQWTVEVPQKDTRIENQTLDYVASKVSVLFKNNTDEAQSLNDIYIDGIPQSTAGYLFKQNANDYVGTQHDASAISFNSVTDIAVGDSSAIQHYYTYPMDGIENAALHATWNEITYDLSLDGITSLARNEHLKIIVTLTPAQDITVNYEIAEWKEDSTNIGTAAPTTPENGYDVKDWGNPNEIVVGGGGGNIWDLGDGTKIEGEEVSGATLVDIQRGGRWDLSEHLKPATNYIQEGYTLVIYFSAHFYWDGAPEEGNVSIQFKTGWDRDIGDENTAYPRVRGAKYVKYITFKGTMNGIEIDGENGLQTQNLSVHITSDVESGAAIYIEKFAIIKPD